MELGGVFARAIELVGLLVSRQNIAIQLVTLHFTFLIHPFMLEYRRKFVSGLKKRR